MAPIPLTPYSRYSVGVGDSGKAEQLPESQIGDIILWGIKLWVIKYNESVFTSL